jgi:hypothetical protein
MTGSSAIVIVTAHAAPTAGNNQVAYVGFSVSGASTVAANDDRALGIFREGAGSAFHVVTGLTPGDNTFTLEYHVSGGTFAFSGRNIIVIPMP